MSAWNETNWKSRFFTIWGGQAISLLGTHLVQFALIWWLTQKTGSATVLATASLVGFLPQVVLGPVVGTMVDRSKRRFIMIAADSSIALATLFLVYLFSINAIEVWTIYILLFVRSLGGGFHYPAMAAATSLMVPKEQLTRVQGLNQMVEGVMLVLGAPLGALLVSLMTTQAILMIDVTTAAFAIFPLLFILIPEPNKQANSKTKSAQTSFWQDFRGGFAYVWRWPGLLILMLLAMLINFLLNPAASLQPLLVTKHFGGGAVELGWLESAFGVGMVVGSIVLSIWGGFKRKILTTMMGVIGLGIFFAVLGLLPPNAYLFAIGAAFLAAFMLPIVNGPVRAIVQSAVEPEMQGRVFTLMGSLAGAMAPLGLIIAGPLADVFGVQAWYVISGTACVITGIASFLIPAVMNIENNKKSVQSPSPDVESSPETSTAVPAL